jgi:hypothetical protein
MSRSKHAIDAALLREALEQLVRAIEDQTQSMSALLWAAYEDARQALAQTKPKK